MRLCDTFLGIEGELWLSIVDFFKGDPLSLLLSLRLLASVSFLGWVGNRSLSKAIEAELIPVSNLFMVVCWLVRSGC